MTLSVFMVSTEATPDGDMFLLADSDGRFIDKNLTAESVTDFLLHKKYQNSYNVCFNLHYDAMMILKLLGKRLKTSVCEKELEAIQEYARVMSQFS